MVQFKFISVITAFLLVVLLSGCIGEKEISPVPTPMTTTAITTTATPLETPILEVTPTGNSILVKLDNRRGFIPNTTTIKPGDEIFWENTEANSVTLVSNEELFDDNFLPYGKRFSYIFKTPGTYTFFLKENNNLKGTIIAQFNATVPTSTPTVTIPQNLSDMLNIDARMVKPGYLSNGSYEVTSLKVRIYSQTDIPFSIKAQIVTGDQILEERSFGLETKSSSFTFSNDRPYFINNTNVTLRLLIQGYPPTEYKFAEVEEIG